MFSIIIPSWNNLKYLQFTIDSILKNSAHKHQIVVHVQDGRDGTLDWVKLKGFDYTHSEVNIGYCSGVNSAFQKVKSEWTCIIEDDVYCFPNWDQALLDFYVDNQMDELTWLAGSVVEARPSTFPSYIIRNYGTSIDTFREEEALREIDGIKHTFHYNHNGTTPILLRTKVFSQVGGLDTDFDPTPGSEEGFSKRLYDMGCRNFVSVKDCVVYHFGSMTNNRANNMVKKDSNMTFVRKHGMTIREFNNTILKDTPWKKMENSHDFVSDEKSV